MKWFRTLYLGESVEKKATRIKRKIEHGKLTIMVHVLTLPSNPENLLDIIPARELLQKDYPKKDITIVGLAGDREEAMLVVQDIVEDCLKSTGTTHVVEYLMQRENQAV